MRDTLSFSGDVASWFERSSMSARTAPFGKGVELLSNKELRLLQALLWPLQELESVGF